jgi:2-desacetyl-2-hydroxyethyl bacteriochlorophyllide A dehydrogenase
MRALIYEGPRQLVVHDVADPEPAAADLLLEVEAVGICGSDVHGYAGETGRRTPGMTMGHEACGRVVALGTEVTGFVVGDRVTFNPVIGCGDCVECAAGRPNRCASRCVIGVNAPYPGAFSERMLLPASNAFVVDPAIGRSAVLIEPLAVAIHAVGCADVLRGASVAVLGSGMIGLGCVWAALRAGADVVYATDLDPAKTALAERLGARPVTLGERSLADALAADGRTHVDRVVDAVGIPATLHEALETVARGGVVSLVGMGSPMLDFEAYGLIVEERTIIGSWCYTTKDFAEAAAAVQRGDIDSAQFIDREVTLDDAVTTFASLAAGEPGQIKTVVLPNG